MPAFRCRYSRVVATLVEPPPEQRLLRSLDAFRNEDALRTARSELSGMMVERAAMWRQIKMHERHASGQYAPICHLSDAMLEDAYVRCGNITADFSKTFYLGTQLMEPEQARAVWAIYVWCRRTDELVDGPQASRITPEALDRWEDRLTAIFEGKPYDILDAALTDTVSKFPLDIQPFRDMVEGMRMDMRQSRFRTFDELYEYCYRVAGTVALMTCPVMGVDPAYKGQLEPVYSAALALGTANQLTNILRDVGEDARQRGRIYLPLDELEEFGISEESILTRAHSPSGPSGRSQIDAKWIKFIKFQIERAEGYFKEAEAGATKLSPQARWPVWAALDMYRRILRVIEANGYNNLTERAYVPKLVKMLQLPGSFAKSRAPELFAKRALMRFQERSAAAAAASGSDGEGAEWAPGRIHLHVGRVPGADGVRAEERSAY